MELARGPQGISCVTYPLSAGRGSPCTQLGPGPLGLGQAVWPHRAAAGVFVPTAVFPKRLETIPFWRLEVENQGGIRAELLPAALEETLVSLIP